MENATTTDMQLLFEEHVKLTDVMAYGFSMKDLIEGKKPIPSRGARFDIYFEGDLTGEKINGKVSGIDFLEVRADGSFLLNLQACITTDDGATIKIVESGINQMGDLKLNMSFYTHYEKYAWLNHAQVVGLGNADFISGTATVKGFLI